MLPEHDVFPLEGDSCTFPRDVYANVQEYSDDIKRAAEYRSYLEEFRQKGEPENKRFLKRGIANSIDTLETIYEVSCGETRELYQRRLENGLIPESWIEETVLGTSVSSDQSASQEEMWLGTLERIKEKDMNSVLRKIDGTVDQIQEAGYRRSAEVIGFGHDLIINKLRLELTLRGVTG
jgi:hypothetical protein